MSIAAEFSLGSSWRQGLEDDLNSTDILLIVATGLQKLSHSFTGFEVVRTVDDWRRTQTDIPSRAEAIRRLVEMATKIKKGSDTAG